MRKRGETVQVTVGMGERPSQIHTGNERRDFVLEAQWTCWIYKKKGHTVIIDDFRTHSM